MIESKTLAQEIIDAQTKAFDSLARYKFWMFGYWAAMWVHLNRIEGKKRPNPFRDLVKIAKGISTIHCMCQQHDKHGETSIMCCNKCGLPTENFWTKKST